ncbi:MAG: hypothetical protein QM804_11495 [Propionicimonas sp.]
MSVDFETRLRTEFASLPVDIPVDAEATLAAGRRARGRRIGAVIGGVAVLAAVAVFSLPGALRTSIPAVPEPIGTPGQVSFGEVGNPSPQRVQDARLTVERAGGALRINVTATLNSGDELAQEFTHPDDGSTWVAGLSEQVWVAVLPSEASWVQLVSHGENGGWAWEEKTLSGLDRTVVLAVADQAGTLDGLIWKRPDGTAWNSLGEQISILGNAGSSDSTIYADPALDIIGMDSDVGGMSRPLSQVGPDLLVKANMASARDGMREFRGFFLLPEGDYPQDGPDPEVVVSADAEGLRVVPGTLSGGALAGRFVVVVSYSAPEGVPVEGTSLIDSLSYTAPGGRRVTVVPGVGEVQR